MTETHLRLGGTPTGLVLAAEIRYSISVGHRHFDEVLATPCKCQRRSNFDPFSPVEN